MPVIPFLIAVLVVSIASVGSATVAHRKATASPVAKVRLAQEAHPLRDGGDAGAHVP